MSMYTFPPTPGLEVHLEKDARPDTGTADTMGQRARREQSQAMDVRPSRDALVLPALFCRLLRNQDQVSGHFGAGVLPGPACNDNDRARGPECRFIMGDPSPLHDPGVIAERLAAWAGEARQAGRAQRADWLVLLAWQAYDRPRQERRAG